MESTAQSEVRRTPQRGEVWLHANQDPDEDGYAIVGRATWKDSGLDGPPDGLVVYRRLYEGAYYVRTLENFLTRFTYKAGPFASVAAGLARHTTDPRAAEL